ncbi:hypothetical protein IFO70_35580 [Phormidium tenue FACHB-886]|nr:hypothetical protein [Phormidium tenue FACHB-886]
MRQLQTNTLSILTNSFLSIATVTLAAIAAPVAQAQSSNGQIRVEYEPAQTPFYQAVSQVLQQDQRFEAIAEILSQRLVLPRNITVSFQECGTEDAYYEAASSEIVICYELLERFRQDFVSSETITAEEAPDFAISAAEFVFLHELGHALIQDWNLPVLGREEDAADQFATVLLGLGGRDSSRPVWAAALHLLLISRQQSSQPSAWDVHSSPLQRFYAIACLIYGIDPAEYSDLPEAILPASTRNSCIEQAQQTSQSWVQLIKPYVRP